MKCPRCEASNPDTANNCNNCGNLLAVEKPQTSIFGQIGSGCPSFPTPRSEGERKLVTVLFADVVDSTIIGESLDPEQVTDIMNGAFAFFNAAVDHFGGTVARLMGDAVLAFFGAPVAHEDDPERAVRSGLEIQEMAKQYSEEVKKAYGFGFNVRVGINTGLAVLDMVGDQIRTEYTAMGDTTNVAARMQSTAIPTEAVRGHICSTLAEVMPTVLVFDDLHWADQASLDLLLNVSDLVKNVGLLIICLLRPDKGAASWHFIEQAREKLGDYYSEITLEPLSTDSSRQLLGNLLHIEDLPDSVRSLILEKAEGNPFFVEEVIRSLMDSKHIVQENGHWRATQQIANATIPDTLAGVLSARIDRLPADTKRVTQAASVVGRIFAQQVLKTICESAPPNERIERLEPHLNILSYEELVRERARHPELEYIFKHALTQEAAYNSLLLRRRKEYHKRTADALEQLYPNRLDELAPTLAQHCWHGEDWRRAADYSIRAGAGAAKVFAMRAAIEHYGRAIEAIDKLPDPSPERLYDALMGWIQAAFRFLLYEDIMVQIERAVSIARLLEDKRRLADALYWKANTYIARGRPTQAEPVLIESFALAEELGDERLTILPNFAKAYLLMDADPRGAVTQLDYIIALAHKLNDKDTEAVALAIKAMVTAQLGEFEQSQEAVRTASQVVCGLNSPMTEADVDLFTGWSYLEMGDAARGMEYGQRSIEKAISTDKIECICSGYACVGFGLLRRQNLLEAIKAFQESIKRSMASGAAQIEGMGRTGLAIAEFLSGRTEAVQDMEKTLESAKALDYPYSVASLSRSLGESYAQLGEFERAEGYLNSALEYYRGNEMRPYIADTLQSLANLYDKQGRNVEAARTRSKAEQLAQDLQVSV